MLRAIINWWRGYSKADIDSVKERLSYPNNSGTISIQVTNPERRALRHLRNLRKPSRATLKPSSSLKPLAKLRGLYKPDGPMLSQSRRPPTRAREYPRRFETEKRGGAWFPED
jgi:hypothetical protein